MRENYVKKKRSSHYVNMVKNVWGVKNFCPSRLESEDEISIKLHMEKLEEQVTRRPCNKNLHLIKLTMDAMFPVCNEIINPRRVI